jgi:hypothetical protein
MYRRSRIDATEIPALRDDAQLNERKKRKKRNYRKDEKWKKQRNTKNITMRIKRLIINTQEK